MQYSVSGSFLSDFAYLMYFGGSMTWGKAYIAPSMGMQKIPLILLSISWTMMDFLIIPSKIADFSWLKSLKLGSPATGGFTMFAIIAWPTVLLHSDIDIILYISSLTLLSMLSICTYPPRR